MCNIHQPIAPGSLTVTDAGAVGDGNGGSPINTKQGHKNIMKIVNVFKMAGKTLAKHLVVGSPERKIQTKC